MQLITHMVVVTVVHMELDEILRLLGVRRPLALRLEVEKILTSTSSENAKRLRGDSHMSIYHSPFSISQFREKSSSVSRCESEFISEAAMRKTFGLSHITEASL